MQRALVVSHEGFLWEARHLIERLLIRDMDRMLGSDDPSDRIHNCQIIHYTRRDLESGKLSDHLDWVRSVCPWDLSLSSNEWKPVVRRTYSKEDPLRMAVEYPRLFAE